MKVRCFHCDAEHEVDPGQVGERMDCDRCGKAFTIRAEEKPDEGAPTKGKGFRMPPKEKPRKLGRKAEKPELKMPEGLRAGGRKGARMNLRMREVPVHVDGLHLLLMFVLLLVCIGVGIGLSQHLKDGATTLVGVACAVLAVFVPLVLLWVLGATRASALRQEHIERLLAEIADKMPSNPQPFRRSETVANAAAKPSEPAAQDAAKDSAQKPAEPAAAAPKGA